MKRHFHEELMELKNKLLEMSFWVDNALLKACDSLFLRDPDLAEEVLLEEKKINQLEIEIDEKGYQLFALGQPVAVDLRLAVMMVKINTDLERIGDHAVNIAERSIMLMREPPLEVDSLIVEMAKAVQSMYRSATDAFLKEDAVLAQGLLDKDEKIDAYNRNINDYLKIFMAKESTAVEAGVHYLMISHNLERVADLTNNIAEDVIYWLQAKEIRHRTGIPT